MGVCAYHAKPFCYYTYKKDHFVGIPTKEDVPIVSLNMPRCLR